MISSCVRCGLAKPSDIEAVARIYVEDFPERAAWVGHAERSVRVYRDVFELMRLRYEGTFLVAHAGTELAGFLVLTTPGVSFARALLRLVFVVRVAFRALRGYYGFPFRSAVRRLLAATRDPVDLRLHSSLPHVYVVAVANQFRDMGIGSALIASARHICTNRFPGISLCVDRGNSGAIRLYQRFGFRITGSTVSQHVMVWEFAR